MKLLEHSETVDPAHASSGGCALHLFPALLCVSPSRLHKMAETSGVDRWTITTRRILSEILTSYHSLSGALLAQQSRDPDIKIFPSNTNERFPLQSLAAANQLQSNKDCWATGRSRWPRFNLWSIHFPAPRNSWLRSSSLLLTGWTNMDIKVRIVLV